MKNTFIIYLLLLLQINTNAQNAPTNISLSSNSMNENVAANSTVGSFTSTDANAGNTFIYTLVTGAGSTDNASFNISGANLRITYSPDFETKNSYAIRVRSTDNTNLFFEKEFTITVINVCDIVMTSSTFNTILCNNGNSGFASVNAATSGTGPYTYNWSPGNPTGNGTTSISNLTVNFYICTVTDASGCAASRSFNIHQPTAIYVQGESQSNVTCNAGITGADGTLKVTTPTGGVGGFTYNWTPGNPSGDGTRSVYNLPANTYTCTVTDYNGCTKAVTNLVVAAPGAALTLATHGESTITQVPLNGTAEVSIHSTCHDFAKIVSNGANPFNATLISHVWIETVQPSNFVKRHYQISPQVLNSNGSATITLYFTQQEFDDFNAVNIVKLPTGSSDAIGKANLLIEKIEGNSSSNGLPGTYSGAISTINPTDANIVWVSTKNRWEVTFAVTGFSGFFVKTISAPLPLKWLAVNGNLNTQKQTVINWKVQENNVSKYEVEKTIDNNSWSTVGSINGKGDGENNYIFTELISLQAVAYYRVKQIDFDNRFSYSSIIKLSNNLKSNIKIYPNIIKNQFVINIPNDLLNKIASIYAIDGKKVKEIKLNLISTTINIENLVNGIYFIHFNNGIVEKIFKE